MPNRGIRSIPCISNNREPRTSISPHLRSDAACEVGRACGGVRIDLPAHPTVVGAEVVQRGCA